VNPASAVSSAPAITRLPITVPRQAGENLCWAAVTAGMAAFFGAASPPAFREGAAFPGPSQEPDRDVPGAVITACARAGIALRPVALTPANVKAEIVGERRPLVCELKPGARSLHHFVVINGCGEEGGRFVVTLQDPAGCFKGSWPIENLRRIAVGAFKGRIHPPARNRRRAG
jgi:Papain-like cysteine protease AvrRpt2